MLFHAICKKLHFDELMDMNHYSEVYILMRGQFFLAVILFTTNRSGITSLCNERYKKLPNLIPTKTTSSTR